MDKVQARFNLDELLQQFEEEIQCGNTKAATVTFTSFQTRLLEYLEKDTLTEEGVSYLNLVYSKLTENVDKVSQRRESVKKQVLKASRTKKNINAYKSII